MHRFFTLHNLPWILLWMGLAALIITLGVMIRTSWGQSHPLRKCAGLSLLAHLLLLCYATTVEIVTGTGGYSHNINVTLVDGAEDGSDDPSAIVSDDASSQPGLGVIDGAQPPGESPHEPLSQAAPKIPPPLLTAPPVEPPAPPPTEVTAKTEIAAEKPDESQPSNNAEVPVAKIPEPAETSNDSQWMSGDVANTEKAPSADANARRRRRIATDG